MGADLDFGGEFASDSAISSAARAGRSIHTRAERLPGIGTVVKGPAPL